MKYIIEYLIPTAREWSVYFKYGHGTKTGELSATQFLKMDNDRRDGKYVFISVEVIQ